MEESSAGRILVRRGVPDDWGEPTEVVAWFADDEQGALKIMVADYANGQRVEYRRRAHDYQVSFSAAPAPEKIDER